MGKKSKVGKARRDKFYNLAKEAGFRSRASFKLLQLNRRYEFLQKSKVCIDLCAAPGSWMQVAVQHMPVSSLIIGIDLVPIKPIAGCTTLQGDITADKTKALLRTHLQTWKADLVMNDGAPNVGKNWLHDAFQQAQLTLAALKLAVEFLRKGGTFVTKIFRSRDYHALIWVFKQMFKKVHATKPKASRNESAEIFVVCQGYMAPDKVDPKFLDPHHVFREVEVSQNLSLQKQLLYNQKKLRAEGYEDGSSLHVSLKISDFFKADNCVELLARCHEIVFDDEEITNHKLTTDEIKLCCQDIKVLSQRDLRNILQWRKKILKQKQQELENETNEMKEEERKNAEKQRAEMNESSDEEIDAELLAEEKALDKQIAELQQEEAQELRRKKRKILKEKRKLRDKMNLNMIIPGDKQVEDDLELFKVSQIKSKKALSAVETSEMESVDPNDIPSGNRVRPPPYVTIDRHAHDKNVMDDSDDSEDDDDDQDDDSDDEQEDDSDSDAGSDEENSMSDDEQSVNGEANNPLVVGLDDENERAQHRADMWFQRDMFDKLEEESDEDMEIAQMMADYKKKGGAVLGADSDDDITAHLSGKKRKKNATKTTVKNAKKKKVDPDSQEHSDEDMEADDTSGRKKGASGVDSDDEAEDDDWLESSDDDSEVEELDSDSDYDLEAAVGDALVSNGKPKKQRKPKANKKVSQKEGGFEIVRQEQVEKLSPEELALGEEIIKSGKSKRDVIDSSFHRFAHNDADGPMTVPSWFLEDERKHCRKQLPITAEQVKYYKERQKAIDARPIKKIAEAKARKKRKLNRKLERARKKASAISDGVDVTDHEKWQQIKQVYKRAGLLKEKKKEVTYVVAKKGMGKRVKRPAGVKGRFKVVDPRMKKDLKAQKAKEKTQGRGKKKGRK